jgi:hypothetical protein
MSRLDVIGQDQFDLIDHFTSVSTSLMASAGLLGTRRRAGGFSAFMASFPWPGLCRSLAAAFRAVRPPPSFFFGAADVFLFWLRLCLRAVIRSTTLVPALGLATAAIPSPLRLRLMSSVSADSYRSSNLFESNSEAPRYRYRYRPCSPW